MKKGDFMQRRTIFQRLLFIFAFASLIFFCLTLFPLFTYLKSTFSESQLEKARQQLNTGAAKLEDTVTGVLNVSTILSSDPRFLSLRYEESDYTAVPANIRNQIKNTFSGLLYPLETISDAALLFDQNVAITQNTIFIEDYTCYYPDFFCVDNLTYNEWERLLSDQKSGFLPVRQITTPQKKYNALIYVTKWGNYAYIYVCLDISAIKGMLIADSDCDGYYFTITDVNDHLLYSDLPNDNQDYQTLEQTISTGNLSIDIHIANDILYNKMKPLYFFLEIYCSICLVILILVILTSTHISTKPIFNTLHTLGLTLEQYQSMLNTQQKILQARFFEKAISGQLISQKDTVLFHTYFPDFPDSYCLLLLRLQIEDDCDGTIYPDPMSLLQSFLDGLLPHAYRQQFNNSELLLLVSETDAEKYFKFLDFIIKNINQEEPSYDIRCVSSKFFRHLENLPAAYRQVHELIEFHFPYSQQRVCTMSDYAEGSLSEQQTLPFTMTDLMTLYIAINYGNTELAIEKLQTYSQELEQIHNITLNRHIHEVLCTLLMFIKLEHPLLLMDLQIPAYQTSDDQSPNNSLYTQLAEPVNQVCQLIKKNLRAEKDSLVSNLISYIDEHYTDCDLCFTTLETEFHCSSSTIRKAFKSTTNVTVSHYIEQKRMNLAYELLSQKDKTIIDVATKCGYTNPNSFYKAYKRIYGCAPTQTT